MGGGEVYTTFAVIFEAVGKAQLELMKQGFLRSRGFRDTAQSDLTAVRGRQDNVGIFSVDSSATAFIGDNDSALSIPLADGLGTTAARRLRGCLRVTQSA